MAILFQDLRYGFRMLRKHPSFTIVSVLTVALGIGANTAMFSVLNTYLFRALPYPDSDRLVRIFRTSPHSQSWPHSPGNFFDHRDQSDVFESMAAYSFIRPNLAEQGQPAERLRGIHATSDFFKVLGVQPTLGRTFTVEEHEPSADGVAVISDRFWLTRFGADPGILEKTIRLDGRDVKIIGVMPASFEHPLLWNPVDIWRPLAFNAEERRNRGSNWLRSLGRLKPGVSIKEAEEAMVVLAANLAAQNPDNTGESLRLEPLYLSMSDNISRNVMWFTFGLAGFVLLIACANLANLQLVRTSARAREYAIRAALGGRRGRLLRQSLTESLAISLIGGALSLLIALWGVEFMSRRLFSELPGVEVALDFRVFGFALLVSLLTGLVFGTVPAWLASRVDVNNALRESTRGSSSGRSQHRLRHALIVGEVAFALVLLAGAGLFLRGLGRFANLDPGWQVDGLLMAQMSLQGPNYATVDKRRVFRQRLEERLQTLPGVERIALSNSLPVWGFNSSGSFRIEGLPESEPGKHPEVFFEPVTPGYFETLGVSLLEGRDFTHADTADRPAVLIVNKTMAETYWPGESSVGKRVGRTGPDPEWQQVVGVVNDIVFPGDLGEPYTRFQAFQPMAQNPWGGVSIMLRTTASPESLGNTLRLAAAEIDPSQAVYGIRTARSMVNQGLGNVSLLGSLLGAFAALGLVLAVVGIYGVTSYSVAQRTGEIGIRMALGAQRKDVLWLVLSKGGLLVLSGSALGLAGAYGVGRLLISLIPTLPTRDPLTLAGLAVVLIGVAMLACYIPARRATKVDPMVALRCE